MRMHAYASMLASFGLLASAVAIAGSIHVAPTTLTLAPGQPAAVLNVTNEGDAPANVQVRVFAWDQKNQKDNLTATQKVAASPPMVTLAPKQTQAVRVVRVDKSAVAAEEAYRLIIDELPSAKDAPKVGVAVQMRYSVPVFALPTAKVASGKVTLNAKVAGNALALQAQNQGKAHMLASNVMLEDAAGTRTPVVPGLLGYVLAGQTMQWNIDVPANAAAKGRPVRVSMQFNGQEVKVDL